MAPKAAPADPAEAVGAALAAADGAGTADTKLAALEPLLELLADEEAVGTVVAQAQSIAAKVAEALAEVASVAAADLTPELAGAIKAGSQMVAALCDAGAAADVLSVATPLLSVIATPAPRASKSASAAVEVGDAPADAPAAAPQPVAAWRDADLTEDRTAALTSACVGLSALASHAPGRLALRKQGAVASLLALVQPGVGGQPALQAQATLALSHLAESPLCRAALNEPATCPSLLALLSLLQSHAPDTDALALRLRAKVLLLLGFCLYDGKLLPQLLGASLVEHALALLTPPAAVVDPEAEPPEPPSSEALQCAAELKSNAATVVAIAGQSAAGREAIVAAGGLDTLAKALSPPSIGADGEPLPPAATDQATSALLANVTLALAHAALSGTAAVSLAGKPEVCPLLASILAPPPEGAVVGWSAVRGNACTALLHIVHQPAGRRAFLAAPAVLPSDSAAPAEDEAAEAEPAAPATALEAVVAVLNGAMASATPESEAPSAPETDVGLLAAAADILNQCATETDGRAAIMSVGGARTLVALLDAEQPAVLLEPVAAALGALAAHPEACVLLRVASAPPTSAADEGEAVDPKSEEAQAEEDPPPPPPAAPPPLAVVPTLLTSQVVGMRRAGAGLAAASCIDSGNAAILIKLKVLPLLVQLAESDVHVGAAARMAIDALCLAVPSALLWRTGKLPTSAGTADGFWAVTRDTELLAVEDLALSNKGPEVVSIDASADQALEGCIAAATGVVSAASPASAPSALARFVAQHMGGAVDYEAYELFEAPAAAVDELRAASGTRVVPLGSITVGSARHRAILFKVLADRAGLKASLEMGTCVRGAHAHHAWNTMIVNGKVVVVDLLHTPGECYEEDSDAARRYQRIGEFAFCSLATRMAGTFELAQQTGT